MRLASKFTVALLAILLPLLAVEGYFNARREVAIANGRLFADERRTGAALRAALVAVWRAEGEDKALALLAAANDAEESHRIAWRWLDAPIAEMPLDAVERARLRGGSEVAHPLHAANKARALLYVPVIAPDGRAGAIEIDDAVAAPADYVQEALWHQLAVAGRVTLLCVGAALLLGAWLVGRPIRRLVERAQHIGAGKLEGTLELGRHDELGLLAGALNDMSDRLAESLQQLRHADRLTTVGTLAAGLAHEVGTPLHVITGRGKQILALSDPTSPAHECARIIVGQSERITRIIRNLLDFARRRPTAKQPLDLATLAKEATTLLEPMARRQGVSLSLETLPTVAHGSADQLQQVLINLVVNAIQASPSGGTVSVSAGHKDGAPALEVRDEGAGIPAGVLPHIFDPFYTTKDVGQGTGLGLAVTYGIVKEHGGNIAVETAPGRGARFRVSLPASAQNATDPGISPGDAA